MNYLSVCSGIEAASVAWHPLGWKPVAFAEIEAFPSQVLAHHYPTVPNLGDMTKFKEWNLGTNVDILVGGTPCQSFSVAGLRQGLEDPRGNLALTYVGILDKFKPKWCVWENVPGVLSSNGGRDFGSFLGALVELGYGFSYRVLDAQYFGVAQRRRRVFVVGCLGDWESPAKVLFESESLRRDSAPSREKRQGVTSFTPSSIAGYREGVGTLRANGGDIGGGSENLIASWMVAFGEYVNDETASAMKARDYKDATDLVTVYETHPADSRVREMGEVCQTVTSRWGTGGGNVPLVREPIPIHDQATRFSGKRGANQDGKGNGLGIGQSGEPMNTLTSGDRHAVYQHSMSVRRLTPIECERLQGFPDNYSNVPWRKSDSSPDSPRYKALGNSMAVPVMAWIGKRIQETQWTS